MHLGPSRPFNPSKHRTLASTFHNHKGPSPLLDPSFATRPAYHLSRFSEDEGLHRAEVTPLSTALASKLHDRNGSMVQQRIIGDRVLFHLLSCVGADSVVERYIIRVSRPLLALPQKHFLNTTLRIRPVRRLSQSIFEPQTDHPTVNQPLNQSKYIQHG